MSQSPKSFRRQFFEIMTGPTVAQVLSFVLMPVISRIYGPAEMGEYGLYVAISLVVGVIANFRYDMAVVIGRTDEESSTLTWMSCALALASGLVLFLGLELIQMTRFTIWHTPGFALCTAASATLTGFIQALTSWHSRNRRFGVLATCAVSEKAIVLGLGIGLGLAHFTSVGLIVAQTAGLLSSWLYMMYRSELKFTPRASWWPALKKFADFPAQNLPSSFLLMTSQQMPSILFGVFFSSDELGFYNFCSRVFEIPINLVARNFAIVYYQHMNRKTEHERLRLFWLSNLVMSILFLPALGILALWGARIFVVIFGANWAEAGRLAIWLAPFTFFRILYICQSSLLLVQRKLHIELAISGSLVLLQGLAFLAAKQSFGTLNACMAGLSISGSLILLGGLALIWRSLREDFDRTVLQPDAGEATV